MDVLTALRRFLKRHKDVKSITHISTSNEGMKDQFVGKKHWNADEIPGIPGMRKIATPPAVGIQSEFSEIVDGMPSS